MPECVHASIAAGAANAVHPPSTARRRQHTIVAEHEEHAAHGKVRQYSMTQDWNNQRAMEWWGGGVGWWIVACCGVVRCVAHGVIKSNSSLPLFLSFRHDSKIR